ncbi:MAG: ATP-binding protein [Spirochaetaceae bacterium]|nr:ATP-binding protein [Spirochaetaceae bacterium]
MGDTHGRMRFFNTSGPVVAADHYCVPPLERIDLSEILSLIGDKRYFVLHAPRQTGKTSALLALRDLLNGGAHGRYRCVYVNVEAGQAARENQTEAMRAILSELEIESEATLKDPLPADLWPGLLDRVGPTGVLRQVLTRWSQADPVPLVLLIDEIDTLIGDTLIAVLRQLRAGYPHRPLRFPQSVILCGVRDVRDYRIHSSTENAIVTGGSAFNIKAESLRIGDFPEAEVRALLGQHSADTGQPFSEDALQAVWELTAGQPWLANALAQQACFRDEAGRDRLQEITRDAIHAAREQLILRRETHLEQLTDKLSEERVRRVMGPVLSGGQANPEMRPDDLQYVRDLGLVARDDPIRVANPIYREVIPRDLTWTTQAGFTHDPAWYVDADGALKLAELLAEFQRFFREHSEHWIQRFQYREAGPQLLLQAFLQRVVNSGGRVEREYGLGRMRTDLLILWPAGAPPDRARRMVIECKLLRRSLEETIRTGLEQTRSYMDRCAAGEGHLVIFDRTTDRPWSEKLFRRTERAGGIPITVWGM